MREHYFISLFYQTKLWARNLIAEKSCCPFLDDFHWVTLTRLRVKVTGSLDILTVAAGSVPVASSLRLKEEMKWKDWSDSDTFDITFR